jgi:hypothetical protein
VLEILGIGAMGAIDLLLIVFDLEFVGLVLLVYHSVAMFELDDLLGFNS